VEKREERRRRSFAFLLLDKEDEGDNTKEEDEGEEVVVEGVDARKGDKEKDEGTHSGAPALPPSLPNNTFLHSTRSGNPSTTTPPSNPGSPTLFLPPSLPPSPFSEEGKDRSYIAWRKVEGE